MSSPDDAPPPYSGPSPFSLLSYDETTAVDDAADSHRLPSYQPRTTRRYHPYLRVNTRPRNFFSRHENTVYDESYSPLDISLLPSDDPNATSTSSVAADVSTSVISGSVPAVYPPPFLPAQDAELRPEEQHRRRVLRLFHLIPEFERAVRQALATAQSQKCCVDTKDKDSTGTDKSATN